MKLVQWHLKWGEVGKAMHELQTASTADPANAATYSEQLGDVHFVYMRDERSAEHHYKEALQKNKLSRRALIQYGMLLMWRGKRSEADELFQKAVEDG
eukprot:6080631-Amphidinium_carterae.1